MPPSVHEEQQEKKLDRSGAQHKVDIVTDIARQSNRKTILMTSTYRLTSSQAETEAIPRTDRQHIVILLLVRDHQASHQLHRKVCHVRPGVEIPHMHLRVTNF